MKFVLTEFTFEYDPPTNVGVPLNVVFGGDSTTIDVIQGKIFCFRVKSGQILKR